MVVKVWAWGWDGSVVVKSLAGGLEVWDLSLGNGFLLEASLEVGPD